MVLVTVCNPADIGISILFYIHCVVCTFKMDETAGAREKTEEERESERERGREYPVPGDIGMCPFQHFQVPSFLLSIVHVSMNIVCLIQNLVG